MKKVSKYEWKLIALALGIGIFIASLAELSGFDQTQFAPSFLAVSPMFIVVFHLITYKKISRWSTSK